MLQHEATSKGPMAEHEDDEAREERCTRDGLEESERAPNGRPVSIHEHDPAPKCRR